jgi:hypothetical protein
VSEELCIEIGRIRNKLKRIPKSNILWMDETYYRLNDSQRRTLVLPQNKPIVKVKSTDKYGPRYDMITFINGDQVFPPIIYTPEERKKRRVKGITADMLNSFIEDYLARSIAGIDKYPLYLLCDKSSIHNIEQMKESFQNGLCFEIVDISFMPTKSAKRLSPLDNGLYHLWKNNVRKTYPQDEKNIVQIMSDEWNKITKEQIHKMLKHCKVTYGGDVYGDCPCPKLHSHKQNK